MKLERIKTYVKEFDKNLGDGIPKGYVMLIGGTSGTMKSSLAYSILYHNAVKNGMRSVYITLEQSRKTLIDQVQSLGMKPEKVEDKLTIVDMGILRKSFLVGEPERKGAWLELFQDYIQTMKKDTGFELIAIDSLNVLEIVGRLEVDRRTNLFMFFEWLRDLDATSFLVTEISPDAMVTGKYDEIYLADGLIELVLQRVGLVAIHRYIRCVKMRSTKHTPSYFSLLTFGDGTFGITEVVDAGK